jgi:hypothetical protein
LADAVTSTAGTDREERVREWVRRLVELPERFAGTASERGAAERIAAWMREIGVSDVSMTPLAGAPRGGFVLALHAGLAAIGCVWGGFFGALLASVAAWSFRSQFRHSRPRLSTLLQASESVNVVGRCGSEAPARRVILSAHIDTAQAGWVFSADLADRFARINRALDRPDGTPQSPYALPEALVVGAALLAVASWLGAHGFLFAVARGIVLLGLAVTCGLTLEWAVSQATPGANDNASAVAAMLACAERLRADLPADVELWLVGTGAEEVGSRGMHAFVESHFDWPTETTYYLNFECVGGGALHYIRSEGMLAKSQYAPTLLELARRVAAGGAFGAVTATDLLAATDGHVPARHGYPALSLISLEPNGIPRNYHRLDDTADGIDVGTVLRAADFAATVARAALRGDAAAIRTA